MSIREVQQNNYITGYAGYEATGNAKTDAFYSGLSSAVEKAEEKGSGEVLGLTMLPYSEMMSYGMSAFYSEKSTQSDPIVRIHSNYGGEQRYYDVHVNEVNPRNASQLEMFALSCYQDDQGITDAGTFGSFSRIKTYASNAFINGSFTDLQDPENVSMKLDWVAMLQEIAQTYLRNSQTYSQYLDADKLAGILDRWNGNF
ncbi:MAG: hypothetical protein PWP24_672 [Clostridiales bacterium]|nr:hypothetical protein [Clostridiales bacterium]